MCVSVTTEGLAAGSISVELRYDSQVLSACGSGEEAMQRLSVYTSWTASKSPVRGSSWDLPRALTR